MLGYYLSALAVFIGSAFLFLTDVRKRRLSRRKTQNSSMKTNETLESTQSPKIRRLSFLFPVEQMSPQSKHSANSGGEQGNTLDPALLSKELTCISEEGMADMDFQDIYFEDWAEFLGGDITSCNKVENCLASEYDPEFAMLLDRRVRRWSSARNSLGLGFSSTAAAIAGSVSGVSNQTHQLVQGGTNPLDQTSHPLDARIPMSLPREIPMFRTHPPKSWLGSGASTGTRPQRSITVIDEASV